MNPNKVKIKHGARSAEMIEVIKVVSTRGNGNDEPFREITQYWTKDGKLLAEDDPCPEKGEVNA